VSSQIGAIMRKLRGFEIVSDLNKVDTAEAILPQKGTTNSAGYDFASPLKVRIAPKTARVIWTNVKAYMQEDEVLMLYVRSSIGIKKGLMLANTVGVIDSDYYNNEGNEGNIGICLYNYTDKYVIIDRNERIAQGVFNKYLHSDNGNIQVIREGGIGSTDNT
jgi:dUTP pyrophosphatase